MADKASLQWIGWTFGGIAAVVMLMAALMVHSATSGGKGLQTPGGTLSGSLPIRK